MSKCLEENTKAKQKPDSKAKLEHDLRSDYAHSSPGDSLSLLLALQVSCCQQDNVVPVMADHFQADEQLDAKGTDFHGVGRAGLRTRKSHYREPTAVSPART